MKHTIKNLPKSEVELEIEVSKEEFAPYFERAVLNLGKDIEIEGFRKGKAPKNILEEKIGKERILMEAAELAIGDYYIKAVLENKVEPISQPKVDIIKLEKDSPLIFKAKTDVLPVVNLPDYRKIAEGKKKNKVEAEEKDIENTLKWLLKSRAKFSLKQGKAEAGDFVEINYQSKEVKDLEKEKKDGFILKEGQFIPGFEDNIIGMQAGEEKTFSLTFPKDYAAKELAGKEVNFKVKLETVQKTELPELTDDFAKSLGNFENVEGLKENIKNGIKMEKEQAESQRLRYDILKEIRDAFEIDIPDALVEREQKNMIHNLEHDVEDRLHISFKEYLDKIKKTEKEISDSLFEDAKKRVKEFLILREIGLKEKIEAKDEEIKEETEKIIKHYKDSHQAENLDMEKLKDYTKEVIVSEKTFKLLEDLAKN